MIDPVQIGNASLYCGDALKVCQGLPDESVNCVVTSPPYFGLRDYDCAGQLGLEPTVGECDTEINGLDETGAIE